MHAITRTEQAVRRALLHVVLTRGALHYQGSTFGSFPKVFDEVLRKSRAVSRRISQVASNLTLATGEDTAAMRFSEKVTDPWVDREKTLHCLWDILCAALHKKWPELVQVSKL